MRTNFKGTGKKRILIISGVHGNERTPLAITAKIINNIKDFSDNYSELTILHGVNKPAIQSNTRLDGDFDLNRAFDGNHDQNELVSKIKNEIEKAEIVIDIHSSKSCVELLAIDNNEYADAYCSWADIMKIPCYVFPGSDGTIKRYCNNMSKPCFTVEVNKLGEVDNESVEKGYTMINNMVNNINHLRMYSSDNIPPVNKTVTTKENCIILPLVNKGDIIQPGQKIAMQLAKDNDNKYLVSNENKPCQVLTTTYIDYQNDEIILQANKQKNISLFSISL